MEVYHDLNSFSQMLWYNLNHSLYIGGKEVLGQVVLIFPDSVVQDDTLQEGRTG